MKAYIKAIVFATLIFAFSGCKDLEELNVDPNNPAEVSTATLMTGAEKKMMDYVYDNWFSGRQALLYPQYWAQRTYTEEDRYQIRESVNNSYFNHLYTVVGNLVRIENLNTDPATKVEMAVYGNNENQIAAAKILKIWLMQVMVDTWGSIPYSEAFLLEDEGVLYPKYDDLNELYSKFIEELTTAVDMINEDEDVFNPDAHIDNIYNGNSIRWKKFGNSLKCRLALRLSKVDNNWKSYIAEAITSGVFEDNSDNAVYSYLNTSPNECYFYRGFFIDQRNDFSIAKPFVDLLKGQSDTLNEKPHPFGGVSDPRLPIYTTARSGKYIGLPYGLKSNQMTDDIRAAAPTFYSNRPIAVDAAFAVPFMTYPELCFILSEYKNFDAEEYEKGVRASLEYWNALYVKLRQPDAKDIPIKEADIVAYVNAVSGTVNAETVATQKYLHLYMQGTEAWAEYRRTGYPNTLLKPGENSGVLYEYDDDGNVIGEEIGKFEPLSESKGDIPARVKYPTNESTLNSKGFNAAVAKLQDGTNNYYSKMFWDVRTTANPHPANK